MITCSVTYEPHLSDEARSSEASRFSITKYGMPSQGLNPMFFSS